MIIVSEKQMIGTTIVMARIGSAVYTSGDCFIRCFQSEESFRAIYPEAPQFTNGSCSWEIPDRPRSGSKTVDGKPEFADFTLAAPTRLVDLLPASGLALDKSEARRLIMQGGVRLNDTLVTDPDLCVEPGEQILQVGKRRGVRLVR